GSSSTRGRTSSSREPAVAWWTRARTCRRGFQVARSPALISKGPAAGRSGRRSVGGACMSGSSDRSLEKSGSDAEHAGPALTRALHPPAPACTPPTRALQRIGSWPGALLGRRGAWPDPATAGRPADTVREHRGGAVEQPLNSGPGAVELSREARDAGEAPGEDEGVSTPSPSAVPHARPQPPPRAQAPTDAAQMPVLSPVVDLESGAVLAVEATLPAAARGPVDVSVDAERLGAVGRRVAAQEPLLPLVLSVPAAAAAAGPQVPGLLETGLRRSGRRPRDVTLMLGADL